MWSDYLLKADIDISTATTTEIIAGIAGKTIAIDHINFLAGGTDTVTIKDGSTAYGGGYELTAQTGVVLDNVMKNRYGVITLTEGNSLNITTSGAVQLTGFVRYRMLD